MVHVMQNRQVLPWLMNDFLFQFSSFKREHDESLDVLHTFTKSVIKGMKLSNLKNIHIMSEFIKIKETK